MMMAMWWWLLLHKDTDLLMDSRLQTLEKLAGALEALYADEALWAQVRAKNPWFTPEFAQHALRSWQQALRPEALAFWASRYGSPPAKHDRILGVLCAGNLPLVGLHDILMGYVAGWTVHYKPSSEDNVLLPAVLACLESLDPAASLVQVERLNYIHGLLATGSSNTMRYFEHYFQHIPHVLRGSRTSVALLTGAETEEDLKGLADDIFRYFGRGCRSVTHVLIPQDYDVQRLFASWVPWGDIGQHAKYGSNYDYHRALFMLNQEPFLENHFVLLREHAALKPPVGVLHYQRYTDLTQAKALLQALESEIQTVVGTGQATGFGAGQSPELWDYADQVDTYQFLVDQAQG
jgi:hypothetical protein